MAKSNQVIFTSNGREHLVQLILLCPHDDADIIAARRLEYTVACSIKLRFNNRGAQPQVRDVVIANKDPKFIEPFTKEHQADRIAQEITAAAESIRHPSRRL